MAKKTKASPRLKHNQAGKTVVNFYNHGTVNIDARQNNSRAFKHENNGCTITTSDYAASKSEQSEFLMLTEKAFIAATRQVVEFMVNGINPKDNI